MEDRDLEIALYREGILSHVARLQQTGGLSQNEACRQAGLSSASVTRWRKLYAQGGIESLRPDWKNCGRKPMAVLDETEIEHAQRLLVQTGSEVTALRMLAQLPECREETAQVILAKRKSKHSLPRNLRAQIALAPDVALYHESPKQTRLTTFINPRTLTYIDASGIERPLRPGDLFERDDMSNNFLCWVPWPWGGDPCSDRYGVRVARGQNLLQVDVASLFFISYNFLVRLKDSYRADDIWHWIGRSYGDIGMPRIGERWERGTWQAKKLRGDSAPIAESHTEENIRLGGMASLGLRVLVSQSATTKIIENRFNFLQRVMSTIPGQIGRERGQMERETKVWMQCQRGERDPREYFLSVDEIGRKIEEALAYVNHEPVEGTVYQGVPHDLWHDAITAAPLKKLPTETGYLFSRDKRTVQVNKGHLMIRYTSPEGDRSAWWFYHPELRRHQGTKVSLYFDEYTPAAGGTAVIAEGPRAGTVLGQCELIEGCPQFALASGSTLTDRDGVDRRKRHMSAVRSEYGATGAHEHRWARSRRVDDGAGQAESLDRGSKAPKPRESVPTENLKLKTSNSRVERDEEADLARVRLLEQQARERGDIITV